MPNPYVPVDKSRTFDPPQPDRFSGAQLMSIEKVTGVDLIAAMADYTMDQPRYGTFERTACLVYAAAMDAGINYRWPDLCDLTFPEVVELLNDDEDDEADDEADEDGETTSREVPTPPSSPGSE